MALLATACGGNGDAPKTITVAGQPVALEDVDRAQAGALLQAKEKVESELAAPPPALPDDLRRLAAAYRDGLGRLAIEAPSCD